MDKTSAAMCPPQPPSGQAPQAEQAGDDEASDGEKFLFWQMAKKLCSEKRRAQRSAAMKAYRQSLEPAVMPTEILWSADGNTSDGEAGGEMVDLGNLLMPPPPQPPAATTTKDTLPRQRCRSRSRSTSPYPDHASINLDNLVGSNTNTDDEEDADSCVSDVTRELPDIDAPTLYPSLDFLDEEVPDLTIQEEAPGKLQVVKPESFFSMPEEEEPQISVDQIFGNCKPNKSVDSACTSSRSNAYDKFHQQMSQNMANLSLKDLDEPSTTNSSSEPSRDLGNIYPMTSTVPPRRTSSALLPEFGRTSSQESTPVLPQRRLSLDSRKEGLDLSSLGTKDLSSMSQDAHFCIPGGLGLLPKSRRAVSEACPQSGMGPLPKNRRAVSESSPVLPRRGSSPVPPRRSSPALPRRESSPVPLRRREESHSSAHLPEFRRMSTSESIPALPQRSLSLDSRKEELDLSFLGMGQDVTEKALVITHRDLPAKLDQAPPYKRTISDASTPVPPRRRLSLDSRKDNDLDIPQPREPTSAIVLEHSQHSTLNSALNVPGNRRSSNASTPVPPRRRLSGRSLDSQEDDDIDLPQPREPTGAIVLEHTQHSTLNSALNVPRSKRLSIASTPVPPRRRLSGRSLDSQKDNDLDMPQPREPTKRLSNASTPVPPRRRLSLDSRMGDDDTWVPPSPRRETGDHSRSSQNNSFLTPKKSLHNSPLPQRQKTFTLAPTREELGYGEMEDRCGDLPSAVSPQLSGLRNSFSSILSNDSTIATWTLGLYKRRKSLDSTVAPPTAPDIAPSPPKRRFSGSSLMREQFATTESRWNCPLSVDSRESPFFSMSTHTVSTLGLSSSFEDVRRGYTQKKKSAPRNNKNKNKCLPQAGQPPRRNKERPGRHNSWCSTSDRSHDQKVAPTEVEIQPGVFLPLRGSKETKESVQTSFVERTSCMSCAIKLLCIADAEYVLCPLCKVVSPVLANLGSNSGGGVGLGLQSDPPALNSAKLPPPRRHYKSRS